MKKYLYLTLLCMISSFVCSCGDDDKKDNGSDDPAVTKYTITVQVSSDCLGMGEVSGSGTYKVGQKITIKAIPNNGYKFVKWDDLNTEATRTIVVSKNATYTAIFSEDNPGPASDVTSDEEKEFLEATAKEFLQYYNAADDFKNFTYIQDVLEESDADEIDDWAGDIIDGLKQYVSSYSNKYGDFYKQYNVIYAAKEFNGQFTLTNGKWRKTGSAEGIKFTMTDSKGKQCVLTVKTSGIETKVAIGSAVEYLGYQEGKYTFEKDQKYVLVPQRTQVLLTQGGSSVFDLELEINLQNISSDGIASLNSSSFSLVSSILVNGVFGFHVDKISYLPNATVEGVVRLTKNGQSLLTVNVKGNGRLHEDTSDKDDDDLYGDIELSEVKQVTVEADILGKVQVKAGVKDGTKFMDYIDAAEDNDYDESTFKRNINNANSQLTAYLYNNNYFQKHVASVKLESFRKSSYRNNWSYRPLMEFSDGTSYTFDEYFDEISFNSVVNLAEDILSDFENLFNK